MSSSEYRRTSNPGYRTWFESFQFNQRLSLPIFVLDFETSSRREENNDSYSDDEDYSEKGKKWNIVNGIQIYFLDEQNTKRTSFLRHDPYFYLLLEGGLNKNQINRIIAQIQEAGEKKIKHVSTQICHDAADLTFLAEKEFIKVTVDHPGSVPNLRKQCENITGIIEWREADVLYNHRVAIDHNIRVGRWYEAEIDGGEIQKISMLTNKAPPELRILAYDIETVFDITREPDPNRDAISMISLFMGETNFLLINDQVVETKDISQIEILVKRKDKEHNKPWVDWCKYGTVFPSSMIIERVPVILEILETEKGLLSRFYEILETFKPDVLADFFGDRFDIPFLSVRSSKYDVSFESRTGFKIKFKQQSGEDGTPNITENYSPSSIDSVSGAGIIHLDAYLFNEKYSYLPKKDLGLKPSVEKKLKIIPIGREALFEIEENPRDAVGYAACDGYITHRYVKELVLDFFISMGQMFPVPASELLTRRAGSLDDLLIDAENHKFNIVGKRRVEQAFVESFSNKITIDSFAYTGGLVEARRSGIFRSDILTEYEIDKPALKEIKEIARQIIVKNSNNTAKKEIKNEFDRKILAKFGDLALIYSEDIEQLLSNFNGAMMKNGVNSAALEEKNNQFRQILEEISQIYVKDVDKIVEKTLSQIDDLIATKGSVQLRGVHVDVTSMYPSQIRQYKLQPSGIVPLSKCRECEYAEKDGSCYFEGDWVIKLTGRRPCRFRKESSRMCDNTNCTPKEESKCENYEPEQGTTGRIQEIFTYDGKSVQAYVVKKKAGLVRIPVAKSYLSTISNIDVYSEVKSWIENAVDATQITSNLDKNHFDTFEDQPDKFKLPPNTFLSLDVRTKKITVLISVYSRVCQKAFNFVSRIMDDFYNTRVKHKFEAQRLNQIIKQKTRNNQPVLPDMLRQQKFHDSTQLGMKVPLNSIYGLLGMKAGVRNASAPCAGITTKLSADLISWAADQLEKIGMVTELDSLDYNERLILKDPEGFIRVTSIGEFTDYCFSMNDVELSDISRGVEYVDVPENWQALSVTEFGEVEWNPIEKSIRQTTNRNIFKITTPFGSIKTTDSHAIFQQNIDRIEPIEVKNLKDEFIVHVDEIPNIQKSDLIINFTECIPQDLDLFVFIPTGEKKKWRGHISSLRYDKSDKTKRRDYYRIPLAGFGGDIKSNYLVGAKKGYKYPAKIKLNEEIAELCGWFVAEGSSGNYNEKISVGIAQKDRNNLRRIKYLIEHASNHLSTQFKVKPALSDSKSKTFRLAMDNIFFYHLFKTLGCGQNAFEKRIPKFILSATNAIKEAFLNGYFKGDGYKQGKRKCFTTSSTGLRDDLYVIGKQLGFTVSINETTSSTSGTPSYVVNFMDEENWIIGSKNHYSHKKLNNTVSVKKKMVKEIEKSSDYVYDLTVSKNNNFVSANGGILCHNTDGVWMWVPRQFPLDFSVNLVNPSESDQVIEFKETLIDKILNERVKSAGFVNKNYWYNDGSKIEQISKSLIQFEQDGPYDFQFVMGKKKYIVYNYDSESKHWDEKEIIGMESKRADFSKLQKLFQEELIKGYLENYNLADPVSLYDIYQNAIRVSNEIRKQVEEGKLDHSYFIKPKALNKPLNEYKSKLPQVTAAHILKDLGFSIDPGIRIQMINIIGNHAIPSQVFDLDFNKVKTVFNKYGICTLSFMLNEITSIEDILKLIDKKQYLNDIFGPGRIFDRMINYPMKTQRVKLETRKMLMVDELIEVEDNQLPKVEIPSIPVMKTEVQPKSAPIPVKIVKHNITKPKRQKSSKRRKKLKTQSLDNIFNFPAAKKPSNKVKLKKTNSKTSKTRKSQSKKAELNKKEISKTEPEILDSMEKKSELISTDEVNELQTDQLFTNGHKHKESATQQQNTEVEDENIVCNHCGAIISPSEILNEGCIHCNDQLDAD